MFAPSVPGHAGGAGASLVLQAQAFTSFLALVFGERHRASSWRGIALAIFGGLVLVEGSPGGEHVPLVGFMLTLAAALSWPAAIFSTKHVPGDPPANHIAGGVSALIPVLRLCLPCG